MPRKVVFDFDKVSFMDSSGIGMIIGRYKTANMLGGKVEMTNVINEDYKDKQSNLKSLSKKIHDISLENLKKVMKI